MNIRYLVELNDEEKAHLLQRVSRGRSGARQLKRAQVLLAAARGESDAVIASNLSVGTSTVYRTKRRFVEEGLEAALSEQPRAGAARKLSGREVALLVAVACSNPPSGRARWTLALLAGELVRRTEHTAVSRETIRRRLAEQKLKPWQQRMWCILKIDFEYIAGMEDILAL